MQIVLQRCTGDQQSSTADESPNDLAEKRVDILDTVCFIDYDVLPAELLQGGFLAKTHLVGGDEDVEVLGEDAMIDEHRLRDVRKAWPSYRMLTRSSLAPCKTTVLKPGTHFATSRAQLSSVDLGTAIRCGPWMPRWSFRYPRNAMVCNVFPRPCTYSISTKRLNDIVKDTDHFVREDPIDSVVV